MDGLPLLDYDPDPRSLVEPPSRTGELPEACVLCYFGEVVQKLVIEHKLEPVAILRAPVFELEIAGGRVGLIHPAAGAPWAACLLEEAIAGGFRRFVVCGGARLLSEEPGSQNVLIPYLAVRDEGTSHHYLPPAREVRCPAHVLSALEATAARRPYVLCKTWTTDALYRLTPARVERRRAEGCLCVEMEAAALLAVAEFRGVPLGLYLYAGESPVERELLVWRSAEACLALTEPPQPMPVEGDLKDFFS